MVLETWQVLVIGTVILGGGWLCYARWLVSRNDTLCETEGSE